MVIALFAKGGVELVATALADRQAQLLAQQPAELRLQPGLPLLEPAAAYQGLVVVRELQGVGAGVSLRQHLQHADILVLREGAEGEHDHHLLGARLWGSLDTGDEHEEEALLIRREAADHRPEGFHEDRVARHLLLHRCVEDFANVEVSLHLCGTQHLLQVRGRHVHHALVLGQLPEAPPDLLHGLRKESLLDFPGHVTLTRYVRPHALELLELFELRVLHLQSPPDGVMQRCVEALQVLHRRLKLAIQQQLEEQERRREGYLTVVGDG
mmetsp:Transcript_73978/g.194039  ORF Transcript_73978/g.194039 Transcript_73978/m.194039 type:complete len:269 (-) Transcript_73978:332-1138(-)